MKNEKKLFPFSADMPRRLRTRLKIESMILTCAEMAGEQKMRKGK